MIDLKFVEEVQALFDSYALLYYALLEH